MSPAARSWVCHVGCPQALSENGRRRGRLVKIRLPSSSERPSSSTTTPPIRCPFCEPSHTLPPTRIDARPRRRGEATDLDCPAPPPKTRVCVRCKKRLPVASGFSGPKRKICMECADDDD